MTRLLRHNQARWISIVSAAAVTLTFARFSGAQPPALTVWDGVYTEVQAARGKTAYQRECSSCHLDSLGGADMAPGLVGDAFLTTWNELSVGALFERTRISMPQDKPATLSRQEYTDIVSYMLQVNKFPAGPRELSEDLATMKAIKILMRQPAD
jgi:S-disulfanyl-L-cysteine oxidoreductase SoxD